MRRFAALVLAVCFLGLGSGGLRFAHEFEHELAHELTHAQADAASQAAGTSPADPPTHPHDHRHPHDESTCELHALLNAPLVLTQAQPLIAKSGLLVTFVRLLATPVERLRLPARIDCRGPPALMA